MAEILYYQAYEQPLPEKNYTILEINELIERAKRVIANGDDEQKEEQVIVH